MESTWLNITVGDYGWEGILIVVQDGSPMDISTFTDLKYILTKPDLTRTSITVNFLTDGTDGALSWIVENGRIDQAGQHYVRTRISKTGVLLTSENLPFVVGT